MGETGWAAPAATGAADIRALPFPGARFDVDTSGGNATIDGAKSIATAAGSIVNVATATGTPPAGGPGAKLVVADHLRSVVASPGDRGLYPIHLLRWRRLVDQRTG